MFINDVHRKDTIQNIAIQNLKKYGIKFRSKKTRMQASKSGKRCFKVPLENLDKTTVTLSNGQQLIVPKIVHHLATFILGAVETEGIFRKEGSKSRIAEIKLSLDKGRLLNESCQVIDVAVVLKCFLRELPEPLIPYAYHELFLRCSLVENKLDAILLACLLLPTEHLNVLTYLMQFFNEVASHSDVNKMNIFNLSVVIGPNVIPIDEKLATKSQLIITKTCDLVKIMIENSCSIGLIPDYVIQEMSAEAEVESLDKRKKKRRSGSLTRMFSGLKKIVVNKAGDEGTPNAHIVTPDLLLTPSINRSAKKRKTELGLSSKKKKDLLNKLPDSQLLNTPFTPHRTPISVNPNPKNIKLSTSQRSLDILDAPENKEKKSQWYQRSRSVKNLKDEEFKDRRSSLGPRAMLERRWSQVSQAANFRKKKRNSCLGIQGRKSENKPSPENEDVEIISREKTPEPDYVRVSKMEYEEIKHRVSEIERRISMELDNVQSKRENENDNNHNTEADKNIEKVITAYEETLEKNEPLSPTTDHLARRLSRELRIRRNSENKIIRSPSARKIGSMRRRSRELERQNVTKVTRHQSWHVPSVQTIPRVSLKRSVKPVVVKKSPTKMMVITKTEVPKSERRVTRSSSFHGGCKTPTDVGTNVTNSCNNSTDNWVSADGFFSKLNSPSTSATNSANGRASVAKLRSQNVGMVLAKAKLFDNLVDSDNSSCSVKSSSSQSKSVPKVKTTTTKIGAVRNNESRMSYRVRALRQEERRVNKKSLSPRRRMNLNQRQRIHMAKQYVESKNKENLSREVDVTTPIKENGNTNSNVSTPKCVPHIKKSLVVRSPKRLCRTPTTFDKKTPLKVLATPTCKI